MFEEGLRLQKLAISLLEVRGMKTLFVVTYRPILFLKSCTFAVKEAVKCNM